MAVDMARSLHRDRARGQVQEGAGLQGTQGGRGPSCRTGPDGGWETSYVLPGGCSGPYGGWETPPVLLTQSKTVYEACAQGLVRGAGVSTWPVEAAIR